VPPKSRALIIIIIKNIKPGGPWPCIYFPQEQGTSVIPSGIGLRYWEHNVCPYFIAYSYSI
jgi:hypothetical protein